MIIIVCGGRDFTRRKDISSALKSLHNTFPITELVHGGCRGADIQAMMWAKENGIKVTTYQAEWKRGKKAGPERNARMLQHTPSVSLVVAFPGGRGTENMCTQAAKKAFPLWKPAETNYIFTGKLPS